MNNIIIRRTAISDIPYLYEICLITGDAGKDATALFNDPYVLGQYFSAPYAVYPDGICFVPEYECRPQGYIVAVPDTDKYNQWLEEVWLPPLRKRYPKPAPQEIIRSENEGQMLSIFHNHHYPRTSAPPHWLKDYPAHLHINLLPPFQGKGLGKGLVNNLMEELIRLGIPGVHLGVNAKNTGAIEFYKKTGFSVLNEEAYGFTMGKRSDSQS